MIVERIRQKILLQKEKEYSINLEKKVEERTKELVEKTMEMESFSYSVSHDLRAPVRHISGFAQILEEEFSNQLDPEGKDYLQRIISSALRMSELIDDLLKLSRVSQQKIKIENINASALVLEILEDHKQLGNLL